MKLLAIETSTLRGVLALVESGGDGTNPILTPGAMDPALRHGRGLIPAVAGLVASRGLTPGDLTALAVGLGPGSYTGLRVGVTAIKTMAYVHKIPLVGIDSMDVIARNAGPEHLRVSVVVDAQRGEVYVADYGRNEPSSSPERLGPTRIEVAEVWAAGLVPGTLVLGPALDRLKVQWPNGIERGDLDAGHPRPEALGAVALRAFASGRRDDPWFLEPVYLRRSAAEDQWDIRDKATEGQAKS